MCDVPSTAVFCIESIECFPVLFFVFWSFVALPFIGQTAVVSPRKLTLTELNGIELELF
jgi:hypothetical protein